MAHSTIEPARFFKQHYHINKLTNDDKGYMWSAGQGTLSRFDGFETINFMSQAEYSAPLQWAYDLLSIGNKVYVSSERSGVWSINTETFEWQHETKGINLKNIHRIYHWGDTLVILTRNSLSTLNLKSRTFKKHLSLDEVIYSGMLEDSVYFIEKGKAYRFNFTTNNKTKVQGLNEPLTYMYADGEHVIFSTNKELTLFTNHKQNLKIPIEDRVLSIALSSQKSKAVVSLSNNRVFSVDLINSGEITNDYGDIEVSNVTTSFINKKDMLWLATSEGIKSYSKKAFTVHPIKFPVKHNEIDVFSVNKGIYLASWGDGLHKFDSQNKSSTPLSKFNNKVPAARVNRVNTYRNELFVPTLNGAYSFNVASGKLTQLLDYINERKFLDIRKIKSSLYVSTNSSGLYTLAYPSLEVSSHFTTENGLSSNEVLATHLHKNDILIATAEGLDKLSLASQLISNIELPTNRKIITAITVKDKIYVPTLGDGIYVLNSNYQVINHIIPKTHTVGIKHVSDSLYVATRKGMYIVDTNTDNSLLIDNTRQLAFSGPPITSGNKIIAGGYFGVFEMPLKTKSQTVYKPRIARVSINGSSDFNKRVFTELTNNDVVSIYLTNFNYSDPKGTRFKYRMNNSNWKTISGNSLTLSQLPPGENILEFMGADSMGRWSKHIELASINVLAPWYKSPSAIILYIALILTALISAAFILFNRTQNTKNVSALLKSESITTPQTVAFLKANLNKILAAADQSNVAEIEALTHKCINAIEDIDSNNFSALKGNSLSYGLWLLSNHLNELHDSNFIFDCKIDESKVLQETLSDIYKVIYEIAFTSIPQSASKNISVKVHCSNATFYIEFISSDRVLTEFERAKKPSLSQFVVSTIVKKYSGNTASFNTNNGGSMIQISLVDPNSMIFNAS